LYVRQSTLKQVIHNVESAHRQDDLRRRAIALGWAEDQISVIDIDQGHSGASSADREGFQHLVAEVSLGRAGIVLGLEYSRLARNSADRHQLLELCAMTGTLICDEDGLYDPRQFNDRLLLGMKGQMSEAELHFIKARLRGGVLSKARRGELIMPLPVGLVHDGAGHVVLDPDTAVQHALRHLFDTFAATGSATACVKACREADLSFPWCHLKGPRKGELDWKPLRHHTVLRVLHNPRYAGAFTYGRYRHHKLPSGKWSSALLPPVQWISFIPDAHPGYITLDQFDANRTRLATNATAHSRDRSGGPPREEPALLQGIIICGRRGKRMTVRYSHRRGKVWPVYVCQRGIENAKRICANIFGADLDRRIGQLLLDTLTPLTIDAALAVTAELQQRSVDAERIRAAHVDRARYRARSARRRHLAVDPATPARERKRIARLLLTGVTVHRDRDTITAHIRFPGGADTTLTLPAPKLVGEQRKTPAEVVAAIDDLLDHHTSGEIADILNQRGIISGTGERFHRKMIDNIIHTYRLHSRRQRLRAAGMLTPTEMATQLGTSPHTVKAWHRSGIVSGLRYNDKGETLPPTRPRQPF